jgi:epoxyqueuosine reductase
MNLNSKELADFISETISHEVNESDSVTSYRDPIVGFVAAHDPGFADLSDLTGSVHMMPEELLPGAKTIVSFFLPFSPEIPAANAVEKEGVARQWALAYVETNALIGAITSRLIEVLKPLGVRAAAEPATGNFDENALKSRWSHKSIAVLAGIGSFGLHHMVITDAGCAGRFGSLVIDAEIPFEKPAPKQRCEYYASGTCLDCVLACPVNAIHEEAPFDRGACWTQCLKNGRDFLDLGADVHICGKCAVVGPCTLESGV